MIEELEDAIREGQAKKLAKLLDAGADVNARSGKYSLITLAVILNQPAILALLLERGADPDATNPIGTAARAGRAKMVDALLAAGAKPVPIDCERWQTPLLQAAYSGHAGIVKRMLAAGAAIDFVDDYGRSALFLAAMEGPSKNHTKTVEILIAAGADVNQRGQGGYTPLGIARRNGRPDVEARLVAAGAIAAKPEKAAKR
ncbi:MAG TPA: ankyrin repeat domain-containing protein [Kofleriaceae bacterium]